MNKPSCRGLYAVTDAFLLPDDRLTAAVEQAILGGARMIQYRDGRETNYFAFGVRAVGGILFDFKRIPLDAFVEVAGVLEYRAHDGDHFGIALNAGAGARYYF